eukprot:3016332-Rhodomonas_salina.1
MHLVPAYAYATLCPVLTYAMLLRTRFAQPDTAIGYAGPYALCGTRYGPRLCCYAIATHSPVLTPAMLVQVALGTACAVCKVGATLYLPTRLLRSV